MSYQSLLPRNGELVKNFDACAGQQLETAISPAEPYFKNVENTTSEKRTHMIGKAATAKRLTPAWKDKMAGASTNSFSFSGDKINTLTSLFLYAMQHGKVSDRLGIMPSSN